MKSSHVSFTLNGRDCELLVPPGTTLLRTLRDHLELYGAKAGCEGGNCGACTVEVDGRMVLSCLTATETVEGSRIVTIEGLQRGEALHPLQAAFFEGFATQCGFCNSGMIMAAKGLLDANPDPSREEVMEAISGNVCRCTGYEAIVDAILDAARRMKPATKDAA